MKIIFNPDYKLKMTNDRVLLYSASIFEASYKGEAGWESIIHPLHAMILSFFNGNKYSKSLNEISKYFDFPLKKIKEFTDKLIENNLNVTWHFQDIDFFFPKYCLIIVKENENIIFDRNKYLPEMFNYDKDKLDFKRKRHPFPVDIHLMLNTECSTNCIYCYADRRNISKALSLTRIFELIKEAKFHDARSFELTGGDIFLCKYWDKIVSELYKNGFETLLSTKTPLKKNTIEKLSNLGVKRIQFSLDSVFPFSLEKILLINNGEKYLENVKKTFSMLKDNNIMIDIHSIIINTNKDVNNIKEIYTFLKEYNNIREWRIDNAHSTLYKNDNENNTFLINKEDFKLIIGYLQKIEKNEQKFRIFFDYEIEDEKYETIEQYNNQKMLCSGNYSSIVILPDGNVTICEEICWNHNFIIGNVNENSIEDVWNSVTALELYNLKQDKINNNSPCKNCPEFNSCHDFKHVCWLNILKAYGDKWDFPDPKCPSAPETIYTRLDKEF